MRETTDYSTFNYSKQYAEEIEPKIKEINAICAKYNMPFFCLFATENGKNKKGNKETVYVKSGSFTGSSDLHLYNDMFKKILLLCCGAELKPLGGVQDNDMDIQQLMEEACSVEDEEMFDDNFDEDINEEFDEKDYRTAAENALSNKENHASVILGSDDFSNIEFVGDL